MFAQAIESLLVHHCTPSAVRAIEGGGSAVALSAAISEAGFHELLAPEDAGGGGASWRDFFEVVTLCGAHAAPLPLPQTLAARLLASDPQDLPAGLITFAPSLAAAADGSLHALHVPMARVASHVIAASGDSLLLLSMAEAQQIPGGVHGSLVASLRWKAGAGRTLASPVPAVGLQPLAALLHAGLLAGAMIKAFDLTMGYANERVQFGKSIGKFQAVQHQLGVMAEQVAAAHMAAESAFGAGSAGRNGSAGNAAGSLPAPAACAVAKARTSEAAQRVASIAHAVHGAIGVTAEYDLQLYTRRLHEWRTAHGSEMYWHRVLGGLFLESSEPLSADFVRSLI